MAMFNLLKLNRWHKQTAAAGSLLVLSLRTQDQSAPKPLFCEQTANPRGHDQSVQPGRAAFWTFFRFAKAGPVVALRNVVEYNEDGKLTFIKLTKADTNAELSSEESALSGTAFVHRKFTIRPDEGYGQICRLTPEAENLVFNNFKNVDGLQGRAHINGINACSMEDAKNGSEHSLSFAPIVSDKDVSNFCDVHDFRMPFGVQNKFLIHLAPVGTDVELSDDWKKSRSAKMQEVKSGGATAFDVFCNANFTGDAHNSGVVGAVGQQRFLAGNNCSTTWVRFDKKDLKSYDHDLSGLPMLEDQTGVFFPVTHLWVDFVSTGMEASYVLEWFCGTRCLARRKLSLWPMPNTVLEKLLETAGGYVNKLVTPLPASA